ncbi:Glycosyl transferase family 2 [Pseudomonas asplenii]|uniref:Glycosyl transferase family 2 n=1 Tax=Pseudomonas asplenii TaxID=53407 RepID=A0A1H6MJ17_9PSED|nr:glycosyltransferase [Pseudomonas fuscovaginae]SEH97837.1 Glycosyl transferase family 2 [Pseudomonas fuscovaginae]
MPQSLAEKPLVSVVVIVYNQSNYIRECIQSILSQDYENFEVIVSDDASTDTTGAILKSLQEENPDKIRLNLATANMGITRNCNAGLSMARGKYVAMFAGDDLMLPGRISKQVRFLEENPTYSICGSYVQIIDGNGRAVKVQKDKSGKKNPHYSLSDLIASNNSLAPVPGFMVRADSIPPSGYDNRLPKASDSLFYYHVASKGDIFILKESLTKYRVHESHAARMGYLDDSLVSLALCEYYFPDRYSSVKKGRGNLYYSQARYLHKIKKDYPGARRYIGRSLSCGVGFKKIAEFILILFKVDL